MGEEWKYSLVPAEYSVSSFNSITTQVARSTVTNLIEVYGITKNDSCASKCTVYNSIVHLGKEPGRIITSGSQIDNGLVGDSTHNDLRQVLSEFLLRGKLISGNLLGFESMKILI